MAQTSTSEGSARTATSVVPKEAAKFGALAGDPRFAAALAGAYAALAPATPDAVRHALAAAAKT